MIVILVVIVNILFQYTLVYKKRIPYSSLNARIRANVLLIVC